MARRPSSRHCLRQRLVKRQKVFCLPLGYYAFWKNGRRKPQQPELARPLPARPCYRRPPYWNLQFLRCDRTLIAALQPVAMAKKSSLPLVWHRLDLGVLISREAEYALDQGDLSPAAAAILRRCCGNLLTGTRRLHGRMRQLFALLVVCNALNSPQGWCAYANLRAFAKESRTTLWLPRPTWPMHRLLSETGRSVCHDAAFQAFWPGIDCLLAEGMSAQEASNNEAKSLLHFVIEGGSSHWLDDPRETMQRLLAAGAAANAQDVRGRTPLHIGLSRGLPLRDGLMLLIEEGAQLDIQDHDGNTPVDMRREAWTKDDQCLLSQHQEQRLSLISPGNLSKISLCKRRL